MSPRSWWPLLEFSILAADRLANRARESQLKFSGLLPLILVWGLPVARPDAVVLVVIQIVTLWLGPGRRSLRSGMLLIVAGLIAAIPSLLYFGDPADRARGDLGFQPLPCICPSRDGATAWTHLLFQECSWLPGLDSLCDFSRGSRAGSLQAGARQRVVCLLRRGCSSDLSAASCLRLSGDKRSSTVLPADSPHHRHFGGAGVAPMEGQGFPDGRWWGWHWGSCSW